MKKKKLEMQQEMQRRETELREEMRRQTQKYQKAMRIANEDCKWGKQRFDQFFTSQNFGSEFRGTSRYRRIVEEEEQWEEQYEQK